MPRSFLTEIAREKTGMGEDWHVGVIDCPDAEHGHLPSNRIRLTGWCVPRLEGGEIAWKYKDPKTRRKTTVTVQEVHEWKQAWEARTGLCSCCHPDRRGEEWVGWTKDEGSLFRTCPRCNGTGLTPGPHRTDNL